MMTNYLLRRAGKDKSSVVALGQLTGMKVLRTGKVIPPADYVFQYGNCGYQGENAINSLKNISFAAGKRYSRKVFADAGIAPKTWISWDSLVDGQYPFTPVVVRPALHSQGKEFNVCSSYQEVSDAIQKYPQGWYISELIQKVKEYRVFIVSGRVAWIANKIPGNPDDVAWNHELGGHFENLSWMKWPSEACRVAIKSMEIAGLDFGGVDVMRDADGKMYVLEINTACTLNSEYRQQCTAKCFKYIIENGKGIIPTGPNPKGYLSYIHPAVCQEALI